VRDTRFRAPEKRPRPAFAPDQSISYTSISATPPPPSAPDTWAV
jgi:hypothetical protein